MNSATAPGAARAQTPVIVNGSSELRFRAPDGCTPMVVALPVPNDPMFAADIQYQGETAFRSEQTIVDHYGQMLAFVVDGAVYDREGYLIADRAGPGCTECLPRGISQLEVVPVPGACYAYFLFYSVMGEGEFTGSAKFRIYTAILDLAAPNSYFPNNPERRGAVIEVGTGAWGQIAYPGTGDLITYVAERLAMTQPSGGEYLAGQLGSIDLGYGEDKWLFAIAHQLVLNRYRISPTGITLVGTTPCAVDDPNDPLDLCDVERRPIGEIEAVQVGNVIRIAVNEEGYDDAGGGNYHHDHKVLVLDMDLQGNILSQTTHTIGSFPLDTGSPLEGLWSKTCGLEFSPDGGRLYFLKPWFTGGPEVMAYIDLSTGQVIPLPAVDAQFRYSELETAPSLTDPNAFSIYAIGTSGALGALSDPNGPVASWDPQAMQLPSVTVCAGVADAAQVIAPGGNPNPMFLLTLQNQCTGLDPTGPEPEVVCCGAMMEAEGWHHTADLGNASWLPGDNPFRNTCAPILIRALRIPTGAHITAQDLTFAFSADAALIIEPGASLTCTNCTFTSACEGEWWKGIRVEGTTSDLTQSQQFQGRLSLWSSEVRNATVGVWCARELAPDVGDPDHYGGRVYTSNSTFRNNITGVRIERYHRKPGGIEAYNLCTFSHTEFITDSDWPDPAVSPLYHARLGDVNGIRFGSCAFRNDDHTGFDPKHRGWGIFAFDATFTCKGSMNYVDHTFNNLSIGVLAFAPDMTQVYTVDGMGFHNNAYYGLIDFQGRQPVVTNNEFHTLTTDALPGGTASCGMYLWSSEGYTVERNTFLGDPNAPSPSAGIWFRGPANEDNRTYDNVFDGLTAGTIAYGDHVGPGLPGTTTLPGLQWLCGDHGQTLDNTYDQMVLAEDGSIRATQGESNPASMAANNRFFRQPGFPCDPKDVYVYPLISPALLEVDYKYFEQNNDPSLNPELRPKCIHDPAPSYDPLSFVDEYYDLEEVGSNVAFDKEDDCKDGFLDDLGGGGHVVQLNEYQLRLQELASATAQYLGIVDGGDKPDLLALIDQNDPWHPSHVLRDEMLQQSPLSDEVLLAAIWREVPMDPWHLTQVLIGNSELTNEVWQALEESEVLSPFFLAMIDQYQGQQSPRAIYEQEIALRQGQKSRLQHRLLRHYAQDTVSSGDPSDSLDVVLAMDPSPTALLARYWLACSRNDAGTAATVEASLHEVQGADELIDLGAMLLRAQGSWSDLQGDDLQALELYAVQEGRQGSAAAWAARIGLAEFDSLPPALIPAELRTLWQRKRQWEGTYDLLQAYPNPANDRVLITFLHGLMAGQFVCYDAQGKLIHAVRFGEGAPFVEIDTRQWAPGLYLATAQRDGYRLGEIKFTISR